MTREASPFHGVLAFFDPLFRRAGPVAEFHYPFIAPTQVGDNETHAGKQLTLMPFHFRQNAMGLFPTLGLIGETLVDSLWAWNGWPTGRVSKCSIARCKFWLVGRRMSYR